MDLLLIEKRGSDLTSVLFTLSLHYLKHHLPSHINRILPSNSNHYGQQRLENSNPYLTRRNKRDSCAHLISYEISRMQQS